MRRAALACLLLIPAASAAKSSPKKTTAQRLADLASALHCGDSGIDEPDTHVACLVAQHWAEAKADALPNGDTLLVGGTVEFPDERAGDWHAKTIPAVGGMRVEAGNGRICENDMAADSAVDQAAITTVAPAIGAAFASLDAPLVVPPVVAQWARERVVTAPSRLVKKGNSWTTRFQSAVELRHLGKRWFLVEGRRGDSGLWISAFTAAFTVAR
jgi:hypothetical protein